MLIASFDFETTGLDHLQDRVTEVGVMLYSTTRKRVLMAENFLVDNEITITKEISDITGITVGMITKFGLSSPDALARLQNYFDMAEAIAGKNIVEFDIPFYANWCLREKEEPIERQLIDIETDIPGLESKTLAYQCTDAGFLNPFPHQALADCMSVLRLIEIYSDRVGLDKIIERAKSPRLTIKAFVDYDSNYLAKKRKYKWHPERKVWYKNIKEMDLETEGKEAPFDIARIEPISSH
jgi:DNA polymerase III alpha subunit (gram-positive type)